MACGMGRIDSFPSGWRNLKTRPSPVAWSGRVGLGGRFGGAAGPAVVTSRGRLSNDIERLRGLILDRRRKFTKLSQCTHAAITALDLLFPFP